MGFALRLLLILFMIQAVLYLGGYSIAGSSILGSVVNTNTLNSSTNTVDIGSFGTSNVVNPSGSGGTFNTAGTTLGLLFTPVIFLISLAQMLFGILTSPIAFFAAIQAPFAIKLIFGGGFILAEVMLILSLLGGRDI